MGSRFPMERGIFLRDDVGVSPHAVDQRSDWLAAEAIECHIEFSQ